MPVLEGAGRPVRWQGCQADDRVGAFGDGLRAAVVVEVGAGEAGVMSVMVITPVSQHSGSGPRHNVPLPRFPGWKLFVFRTPGPDRRPQCLGDRGTLVCATG